MLAVVLAGAGVGTWLLLGGSEPELARGELFLEPATDPGLDAFTTSVATQPLTSLRPLPVEHAPRPGAAPTTPTEGEDPPAAALPGAEEADVTYVTAVEATRPGLYGGTRDSSSCDVEQLIAFLQANPAKASAFAGVFGMTPDQLPAYLRSLTPLLLRNDTRVTNHGFANGVATPRHAILQAGTAVLVDAQGIPRVRCACGNPLLPPRPTPTAPTTRGAPWPGFDLTQVITIINTTNINITEFVILDATSGGYLTRTPGAPTTGPIDQPILVDTLCDLYPEICRDDPTAIGVTLPPIRPDEPPLATGDVQITLRWDGPADLDLAVTSPLGDTVFHANPSSETGGYLDVDANPGCQDTMAAPVENVVWPEGAPDGTYLVEVILYDLCGAAPPVAFTLTANVNGQPAVLTPLGAGPLADAPASYVPAAFGPLAQAVGDAVSPSQPRLTFAVDKGPDPGSTYDPPPQAQPPPPSPPPPPTTDPTPPAPPGTGSTPPPSGGDPPPTAPGGSTPCDPATQPCPIYVCSGQETLRTGDYETFYGQRAPDGIGLLSACCPPGFPPGWADPSVCREDPEAGRRCTTHLREMRNRFPGLTLRSEDVCF